MARQVIDETLDDSYEYHGSTMIERIRTRAGETVWRDWLIFDTVEEAADFYFAACCNA